MSKTTNWKNSEKSLEKVLREFNLPAKRISRGSNFAESTFDVEIEGFPQYKLDSKYSQAQPFRHHGKLKTIEAKYCKEPEDIAILYTRNYKEQGGVISVDSRYFSMLLSFFLGAAPKEELLDIYFNRVKQ